jgi:UDP-N-acetylglucosamine:LPS N-acetylglucosamine transferase
MFSCWDNPALFRRQASSLGALRRKLANLLAEKRPEMVLSTYPVYGHLIQQILADRSRDAPLRPFGFITVITDSISVCSAWFTAPSDLFIVPNSQTAKVLLDAGVDPAKVKPLGFPVSPAFAETPPSALSWYLRLPPFRILYVINTGKSNVGSNLERLLQIPEVRLTVTAGRNESLKGMLSERLRPYGNRVQVLGWTNQMPRLLMSHHLLIGKAGGAMVQEAIAACCPMLINQVIPGQEEGNARLIEMLDAGKVAKSNDEVPDLVRQVLADDARQWKSWRGNLTRVSVPNASLNIAKVVLDRHPSGARSAPQAVLKSGGLAPALI